MPEVAVAVDGKWRVHTARLFAEIIESNQTTWMLRQPLLIMDALLRDVALRASVLNDPKLNALMAQLTLYDIADPESPNYDKDRVHELIYCNGLQR